MLPGLVGELLLAFLLFAWEARAQTRFDFPGPQISPGDYSYAINFPYGGQFASSWREAIQSADLR